MKTRRMEDTEGQLNFLIDTAKLKGQKDNVAEIELDTTVLDKPADKLTIRIEYLNDKWLLASRLD